MKPLLFEMGEKKIVEVIAESTIVTTPQDALELLINLSHEHKTTKIILHEENITSNFFVLKTRLAGEILQKIVNYGMQLAIVGDFKNVESESLRAFIIESNRGNQVSFVDSVDTAKQMLFSRDL